MTLPALWQSTSNYKISTEVYEGPLDLLLHLIEQAELDITKLSLAKVTDQYLYHLKSLQNRDPTEVSAFLVIAAKLVLIKSSILLPSSMDTATGEEEEDVGAQLARQLIEYKKFKEIALWLKDRQEKGLRNYIRITSPLKINEKLDIQDLTVYDLVDVLIEIYFQNEDVTPLSDVVSITTLTLKNRIIEIVGLFQKNPRHSFNALLPSHFSRLDLVVTFLAILELIKNHSLIALQDNLFSDIIFEKSDQLNGQFEPEL